MGGIGMILSILLWVFLLIYPAYLLVFAIAGRRYVSPKYGEPTYHRRLAVVIPAYQEDAVILESVATAIKQDYPSDRFDVIVIADGLSMHTIKLLANMPVRVIPVAFRQSTKVKAIRAAMHELEGDRYDAITILDADNHMMPGFLVRTNAALHAGFSAIQGVRKAKNSDGSMARLDGLTESINTHIFRRGHRVLGLPSALTGSGMTFEWTLFRRFIDRSKAVGGFDKELELMLTHEGVDILYDEQAVVLDEKVASASNLSRQRSRWMGAQWHYARLHGKKAFIELFKTGNLAYADKAFQMVMPPRVLLLAGLAFGSGFVALFASPTAALPWASAFLLTVISMLVSVPKGSKSLRLRDWLSIPYALTAYVSGLLKSGRANRSFVHTKHNESLQTGN